MFTNRYATAWQSAFRLVYSYGLHAQGKKRGRTSDLFMCRATGLLLAKVDPHLIARFLATDLYSNISFLSTTSQTQMQNDLTGPILVYPSHLLHYIPIRSSI